MNCILSSNGLLLALVSMAITSQASASNTAYRFTDLGTLGGSESSANAINNAGMVAGWARTASGEIHATVWNAAGITDLGTLGGAYSIANDINDLGQVVGAASTMGSRTYATLWNGTQATQLGTSINVAESAANAINNSGQAVGWTQVIDTLNNSRATFWGGGLTTYLDAPDVYQGSAEDINDAGQVVGSDAVTARLWNGTTATQLGSNFTTASAINSSGRVAGSFIVFDFYPIIQMIYGAIVWNSSDAIHGMTLDGLTSALAINEIDQVVGSTFLHAAMWNDGTVIDLNSFLDANLVNNGWELAQATDINDNGWIVGNALNTQSNTTHAFLLTPVSEADSYAMFIAGLGLLGFVAYRRRLPIPSCA